MDRDKLLDACERWIQTAQDETENINGWRYADPGDRLHRYWSAFPNGDTLPSGFTSDTLTLIREIPAHCNGVDCAALHEILGAVSGWHETRSAEGLPAPASLASHLAKSLVVVVGLRDRLLGVGAATPQPNPEDERSTADKAVAAIKGAGGEWINATAIGKLIVAKPNAVRMALSRAMNKHDYSIESCTTGERLGYRWTG